MDAAFYSSMYLHQFLVQSEHYSTNPEYALYEAFFITDKGFALKNKKYVRCILNSLNKTIWIYKYYQSFVSELSEWYNCCVCITQTTRKKTLCGMGWWFNCYIVEKWNSFMFSKQTCSKQTSMLLISFQVNTCN